MFHAFGINRATDEQGRRGNLRAKVEREVSMEESAEKIYRFWHDFSNLPLIMTLFGEDSGVRIDEDLTLLKGALGPAHEDCDAQHARPSTPWPISCPQDLRMLQ